eukprot:GHVL01038621.1.p2 GENE.GHVL01038621.1~~GHVL01038621.1.p2  ORF type:complete len:159 (+),score=43.47 GHVL01038621.1:150-626(+)
MYHLKTIYIIYNIIYVSSTSLISDNTKDLDAKDVMERPLGVERPMGAEKPLGVGDVVGNYKLLELLESTKYENRIVTRISGDMVKNYDSDCMIKPIKDLSTEKLNICLSGLQKDISRTSIVDLSIYGKYETYETVGKGSFGLAWDSTRYKCALQECCS